MWLVHRGLRDLLCGMWLLTKDEEVVAGAYLWLSGSFVEYLVGEVGMRMWLVRWMRWRSAVEINAQTSIARMSMAAAVGGAVVR